jgi:hypothetical protein
MSSISNIPMETKVVASDDGISYGTHTMPREFWTSTKGSILRDPDFKARRAAKSARHAQNKAEKAEANNKRAHAR